MRQRAQEAETLGEVFGEFLIMVAALIAVPTMFYYFGGLYAAYL